MIKHIVKISFITISALSIGLYSLISYSQQNSKINISVGNVEAIESDNSKFIKDVMARVKKDYVEEKTDLELTEAAVSGILSSLDPHSSYLDSKSFKEMQVQTKGEFGGLGIEVTLEFSIIKVISPIEGTPAFKAGIKTGDYISEIDGHDVSGLTITQSVDKMRGKPGTKVTLTILREGETKPMKKVLTREIINIQTIKSATFKNIAYIKINTFSEKARDEMVAEINKIRKNIQKNNSKQNIEGLILDLRGNPGGLLDQAVEVSDVFLSKDQTIVSIAGRDKTQTKYFKDSANETLIPNIPIVVLINEGSASASEIVAGALQDNKRAVVMGAKSFGKGSVQTVIPLQDEKGALRLTTAFYYTPSGISIQASGIEPDIFVSDAKIEEKENLFNRSEASLEGHLKNQINEAVEKAKKESNDFNKDLYKSDYQLARALDLIKGISVYKSQNKKK